MMMMMMMSVRYWQLVTHCSVTRLQVHVAESVLKLQMKVSESVPVSEPHY